MGVHTRIVRDTDVPLLVEARNKYRENFFSRSLVTEEGTRQWLETRKDMNDFMFVVEKNHDPLFMKGLPVLSFSIYGITKEADGMGKRATFGRIMRLGYVDDYDTEDCITEITDVLKTLASGFDIWYYMLETYTWNKRAIYFFSRLGFRIYKTENGVHFMSRRAI